MKDGPTNVRKPGLEEPCVGIKAGGEEDGIFGAMELAYGCLTVAFKIQAQKGRMLHRIMYGILQIHCKNFTSHH